MQSKRELRKAMNIRLQALSGTEQAESSAAICSRLAVLPQYKQARRIMAFLSMPGEVCLDAFIARAIREGRQVYVPKCISKGIMEAVRLESLQDAAVGAYGIRTAPEGSQRIDPAALDLIIVSGLAFDGHGGRLGRGAGFYDRFLAPLKADRYMAVAWDMQIVEHVPVEDHDIPLPAILTEQRYIIHWK